ncbi:MAG: asparagine synthase (glutamine-hydrolyzing) [Planctomycetota bacterium]
MCGIAGAFSTGEGAVDRESVQAMLDSLAHRGPDDEGLVAESRFALGCKRLAVLDLSAAGRQPHQNDGGTAISVLNGEIYNHEELRADLTRKGHHCGSRCDAELIPRLYTEYGDLFPNRLRGMFALALVDRERQRLLLARDRMGQKPLYFEETGGQIRFASEPRALRLDVPVRPDPASLVRFLTFGYVPAPGSAFAGLRRVLPGQIVLADQTGVELKSYWEQPRLEPDDRPPSEWQETVWSVLAESVREQLQADVPVGLFLSGGIDSGLIAAAASGCGSRPESFCAGFSEEAFDERRRARQTAGKFDLPLREILIQPAPEAAARKVAAAFDEPFGDSSAYPTLLLAEAARQRVKVVLSGDGGDELFAGYRRHLSLALATRLERFLPGPLTRLLRGLLKEASNGTAGRTSFGSVRRFCSGLGLPPGEASLYWSSFFRAPQRARFLHPDLLEKAAINPEQEALNHWMSGPGPELRRALHHDQARYLPDDLLVKTDIAAMSCGLEVRAPLLDHRLVELAATIPERLLLSRRRPKLLLRRLAEEKLPREVARGEKRGFGVPLCAWMRGPMLEMMEQTLLQPRLEERRLFRQGAARELIERHRSGKEDWSAYLWSMLVLEHWFRRFVDRDGT